MDRVISYQVADFIDTKSLKPVVAGELLYSDATELFYKTGEARYIYLFRYGAISFFNYADDEIKAFLDFLKSHCRNWFPQSFSDEMKVQTGAPENRIGHNKIEVKDGHPEVLRMIMLNVTQSVTLDYYASQTELLLGETNHYTQQLEKKGKLYISGGKLKRFIGKTLLLKNRIAENLYIFDSPVETWENEELDRLYSGLKKNFDLNERFRDVSEGLNIVRENLELFKNLLQYRNSVLLEWIIIILIAIEVIHFLIAQIF
jgi:uncharacterized Rmd1/YagE family protein